MTLSDDLIIINDFFDDPDKVREKALLCDYDYSEDVKEGWRGYRTKVIPGAFNDPIINLVSKFYGVDKDEYHSTVHFHISYEDIKNLLDFPNEKWHTDCSIFAGLVYLTPNPPPNSGTCLIDGENNRMITVNNVYNRIIIYPSNYIHGPEDLFGDTKECGRMTLTFFVWKNS